MTVSVFSLFTENVLSHPCIVFRRQCQVRPSVGSDLIGQSVPSPQTLHSLSDGNLEFPSPA